MRVFGFHLEPGDLPNEWDTFDLTKEDIDLIISEAVADNEQLAPIQENLANTAYNVQFLAFDFGSLGRGKDFKANLIAESESTPLSLEATVSMRIKQSKQLGFYDEEPVVSDVSIAGLPAKKVEYAFTRNATPLKGVQYDVIKDKTWFVLTFTTAADDWSHYRPIFDESAATFQLP